MHSNAQAGLEYLMTYGWALVLIVTVAGVLFFVMAPPTGSFVCTSSQPEKIIMKQYNFPYSNILVNTDEVISPMHCDPQRCIAGGTVWAGDPPGEMILQNGTGGPITITGVNHENLSVVTDPGGPDECVFFKNFFPGSIQEQICCYDDAAGTEDYGLGKFPNFCYLKSDISVTKGGNIKLHPGLFILNFTDNAGCNYSKAGFSSTHSFSIAYRDQFGYDKNVDVTCQGYPPKT